MEEKTNINQIKDETTETIVKMNQLLRDKIKNAPDDIRSISELSQAVACLENSLVRYFDLFFSK